MSTGRRLRAALVVALLAAPAASGGAERPQPAGEPRPGPGQATPDALRGACYLTFAERRECVADTTEPECRQSCDTLLCDSYAWLDRLPCWNWGYGG